MALDETSSPRRRSLQAPVHGRRPRPTSAAELIDDTFSDFATLLTEGPVPAALRRRTAPPARRVPPSTPRPRRTAAAAPSTELSVPTVVEVVEVVPAPAPAAPAPTVVVHQFTVNLVVPTWFRRRERVRTARRARTAPPPLRWLLARRWSRGELVVVSALAAIIMVASLAGGAATLRSGMAPTGRVADTLTVLPTGTGVSSLTLGDATAMADPTVVPDASAVAPIVTQTEQLTAGSRTVTVTMTGSTPGWLPVMGRSLASGRMFTIDEVNAGATLAVLGSSTAQTLFPGGGAAGGKVSIDGHTFSVIGVLRPPTAGATDAEVLVPVTAAQGIMNIAGATTVDRILVSTAGTQAAQTAYQEVDALLLQTHHSAGQAATNFSVSAPPETSLNTTLVALLGALAAVSLFIGAVAIRSLRRAS